MDKKELMKEAHRITRDQLDKNPDMKQDKGGYAYFLKAAIWWLWQIIVGRK